MKSIINIAQIYKDIRKNPTNRNGNSYSTETSIGKSILELKKEKEFGYGILFMCIVAVLAILILEYSQTMNMAGLISLFIFLIFVLILFLLFLLYGYAELLLSPLLIVVIGIVSVISYLLYYLKSLIERENKNKIKDGGGDSGINTWVFILLVVITLLTLLSGLEARGLIPKQFYYIQNNLERILTIIYKKIFNKEIQKNIIFELLLLSIYIVLQIIILSMPILITFGIPIMLVITVINLYNYIFEDKEKRNKHAKNSALIAIILFTFMMQIIYNIVSEGIHTKISNLLKNEN